MRSAQIRPALPEDIEAIQATEIAAGEPFREIGLDSVADDDPPSMEELTAAMDTDLVRVVEVGGRVAAWAWFTQTDGYLHIEQVSTHPDFRGQRLGTSLIRLAGAIAAQRGLAGVTLTTFGNVPWNAPYYESLGFAPLPDGSLPHLTTILRQEADRGLDVAPRVAMVKPV